MLESLAGWLEMSAASPLFLVSHAIPRGHALRPASLVSSAAVPISPATASSLLVLAWLIAATDSASYVELWPQREWHGAVPASGMLIAVLLAVLGLLVPIRCPLPFPVLGHS